MMKSLFLCIAAITLVVSSIFGQSADTGEPNSPLWHASVQYIGITYHPDGGSTPEVYPLKLDRKAFLVLDVGLVGKLDYQLNDYAFIRFTTALYMDCAFVAAGCLHFGPRLQYSWGDNQLNVGIGPIFSFRQDWHRFEQYQDDEFYGDRVFHGWQYRLFPTALEFEYLRRISDTMQLQWSLIPGAPLIITSLIGVRFAL